MKRVAVLVTAFLAFGAQAPASPVRHLEYAFSTIPASAGVTHRGTLSVDIAGVAPDGGVIVRGTDAYSQPWALVREHQTIECEVYDGGSVACTQPPNGLSPVERTLFPLLARGFFEGGTSRLYRVVDVGRYGTYAVQTVSQLEERSGADPAHTSIAISSVVSWPVTPTPIPFARTVDSIVYDRAANVPVSIRAEWTNTRADSVYAQGTVELTLTKDVAG
jgi:hypothetical protein